MTVASTPSTTQRADAAVSVPSPATVAPTPTPTSHPTPCPSWCKDRRHVEGHHFGPTATWHWGTQVRLANPSPLPDAIPVVLRAELFRSDEDDRLGEVSMYVSGETDMEMGRGEVDVFIVQAQAFVDSVRAMRRQMG
jgi:hypothetical protein